MIFGHQTDDTQTADDSHITALVESTESSEVQPSSPKAPIDASVLNTAPQPATDGVSSTSDDNRKTVSTSSDLRTMAEKSPEDHHDLLALKQEALQQLTPLVHQLDQTPEERFRTTMMMIQSTDNQALIKDAYAAAQSISDDKVRAQALLDIINEINYFTIQKK